MWTKAQNRMTKPKMLIRPALDADKSEIWGILEPVIRAGTTYTFPQDMHKNAALTYWFSDNHQVFVATEHEKIIGTYFIRPNQTGRGTHIANCAYMTSPSSRGKGVATAMCIHSQDFARANGYTAIQFNFVVATNIYAIRLWEKLGFETLASLPEVFDHPVEGLVDALVMFKKI